MKIPLAGDLATPFILVPWIVVWLINLKKEKAAFEPSKEPQAAVDVASNSGEEPKFG